MFVMLFLCYVFNNIIVVCEYFYVSESFKKKEKKDKVFFS